jgi:YggT family protein
MSLLFSLFSMVTAVLGSMLLLRAYLWSLAISPRDPLVAFAWKFTDWLVNPIASLIKPRGVWDLPTLLSALIVAVAHTLVMKELTGFPVTASGFVLAPVALVFRWAIELVSWGVIIYCVMSFMTRARYSPFFALLHTLCNPFLSPIRKLLPTVKGFDLSPIVLFILLNVVLHFILPISHGMVMF